TLLVDNSLVNVSARLASSTAVNLNSGTLNFLANNSPTTTAVTLGTVTLNLGHSTIQAGFAGTPVTGAASAVTIAHLARSGANTVNFVGNNQALGTTANLITLTQINGAAPAAALVGNSSVKAGEGILPWAEVTGPGSPNTVDFATYGLSGGAGVNAF